MIIFIDGVNREATKDEEKEIVAAQDNANSEQQTLNAIHAAKQVARQAVLDKLGLTADEAKVLLG